MKNSLLIISILLLIGVNTAKAQRSFISTYVEKTHVSPKQGVNLGFEFKGGFEVGMFYQKESSVLENRESSKPRFYEKKFTGISISGPVLIRSAYDIKLNVRTGISNNINFAITPSILANWKVLSRLEINTGLGIRAFKPTYIVGIRIH
ncbi:MAG: hypothetical protein JXR03_10485 [Cyclobacteriaceae bacterium]